MSIDRVRLLFTVLQHLNAVDVGRYLRGFEITLMARVELIRESVLHVELYFLLHLP